MPEEKSTAASISSSAEQSTETSGNLETSTTSSTSTTELATTTTSSRVNILNMLARKIILKMYLQINCPTIPTESNCKTYAVGISVVLF